MVDGIRRESLDDGVHLQDYAEYLRDNTAQLIDPPNEDCFPFNRIVTLDAEDTEGLRPGSYVIYRYSKLIQDTLKAVRIRFLEMGDGSGIWYEVIRNFFVGGVSGTISVGSKLIYNSGGEIYHKDTNGYVRQICPLATNALQVAFREGYITPCMPTNSLDTADFLVWFPKSEVIIESYDSEDKSQMSLIYVPYWLAKDRKILTAIAL